MRLKAYLVCGIKQHKSQIILHLKLMWKKNCIQWAEIRYKHDFITNQIELAIKIGKCALTMYKSSLNIQNAIRGTVFTLRRLSNGIEIGQIVYISLAFYLQSTKPNQTWTKHMTNIPCQSKWTILKCRWWIYLWFLFDLMRHISVLKEPREEIESKYGHFLLIPF